MRRYTALVAPLCGAVVVAAVFAALAQRPQVTTVDPTPEEKRQIAFRVESLDAMVQGLRTRGVDRQLAWNTVKSAHGPWRLRQSPARAIALPQRSFAALGLPSLLED